MQTDVAISEVVRIPCKATDSTHEYHEYPRDWVFGGPQDDNPAADPRWKPTNYTYWSDKATPIWVVHHPKCDDEAMDYFTTIAEQFPMVNPVRLSAKRPGAPKEVMLPVKYNRTDDTLEDV